MIIVVIPMATVPGVKMGIKISAIMAHKYVENNDNSYRVMVITFIFRSRNLASRPDVIYSEYEV